LQYKRWKAKYHYDTAMAYFRKIFNQIVFCIEEGYFYENQKGYIPIDRLLTKMD
jgi:hypothetical protein